MATKWAILKDNPAVTEYNPELRVEDDVKGIQFCFKYT